MKRFLKIAAWVLMPLVVIAGITFVASKQETAAKKYEAERESRCAATFPSPWETEQQDACKHERDSRSDYLAWGYELFTWPEGITTWAILLTLAGIFWQAKATADAARAAQESNRQNAEFFRTEKRPWVGIIGDPFIVLVESERTGHRAFRVEYTIKNFGVAPAFNVVVPFSSAIEEANAYDLVKSKINEARKLGENILSLTGDLLLPGAEKMGSCEFSPAPKTNRFTLAGCIVYRFSDGSIHYTELSYFADWDEGGKAKCRTAWFQDAD